MGAGLNRSRSEFPGSAFGRRANEAGRGGNRGACRTRRQRGGYPMCTTFLRALTATTALVSALAGSAALADCQPNAPANGATVTCSGADADGFSAGAATNLTVNVLAGATVTAPATATAWPTRASTTVRPF